MKKHKPHHSILHIRELETCQGQVCSWREDQDFHVKDPHPFVVNLKVVKRRVDDIVIIWQPSSKDITMMIQQTVRYISISFLHQ